jgi:hypothetical protein
VSSSGLIYAAIAIMWAAVLIPMWLRNHDAATENRSAERFGQAMRVLSRKEGRDQEASDVVERADREERSVAPAAMPSADPTRRRAMQRQVEAPERRERPSERRVTGRQARTPRRPLTLAQRRARSLGVLAGLTVMVLVLSMVTPLPWWAMLPFVAVLCAFVVHLRIQARQKLQRRSSTARTSDAMRQRPAEDGRAGAGTGIDADANAGTEGAVASGSVVQGPSRAVVVERKGEASVAGTVADQTVAEDEDAWRPNPLPLPTYVTAPKAVRPIKVIDLTTPGAWSSGRLFDDDVADEDLLAAQVAEDELDALLEQEVAAPTAESDEEKRRAVGD